MQSFRTEYEEQWSQDKLLVQHDIVELGNKIAAFQEGTFPEDKFRALRLARGVYGQRQQGMQMIRIKLPYGKVTANQLRRIAQVSDTYSTGKLHITTRQDIQLHHVSLDRTPELWAELEKDDVTLREACGNTVRNVTASDLAGIDPDELFDVTPYAENVFRYFLRKPFGQELGRKIKIAFSSSDHDTAFTFMHDFGFIPRVETKESLEIKGFKVLIGGGLGAQPFLAKVAYAFLPATEIIPFMEAAIRVFDRHGERNSRSKARLKYLIAKIGLERFLSLVAEERLAVQFEPDDFTAGSELHEKVAALESVLEQEVLDIPDEAFDTWRKTNVLRQKQEGYCAVYVKVSIGDFNSENARELAVLLDEFELSELRFTIDQNIQIRFVPQYLLKSIYERLVAIGMHTDGYNSVADITACPGTDTCNLGISNSTQVALEVESLIRSEYPFLLEESRLKIKISGCMNACGQHALAQIGFHGSSIKTEKGVLPALQVVLGGGQTGGGIGRIAEKVIKVPSKRILKTIRYLLDDYLTFHENDEDFTTYFDRRTTHYFYLLLKPLADVSEATTDEYCDWGQSERFATAIGVGECAGVMIDLVATLLLDAFEKLEWAYTSQSEKRYADAMYFAYSAAIYAAKAALIRQNVRCNTHQGILHDFDTHLGNSFGFDSVHCFSALVLSINQSKANEVQAEQYIQQLEHIIYRIKEQQ